MPATVLHDERAPAPPGVDVRHYVTFAIHDQTYGIAAQYVQEIVALPELVPLPTAPSFVEGFVNVSGVATPVVRMDRLLGMPGHEAGLYTPVLLLQGMARPLALLVDRVQRVVKLAPQDIVSIAGSVTVNDFTEGVAEWAGEQLILIDPERLLLAEEAACLERLQEAAQQRIQQLEAVCA